MVEHQSAHRMELETFVIARQQTQSSLGQWLGFILAVLFLIGAVYTTVEGFPWVGGILGGTTIISLVTVFVLGKNEQKQNLRNKST